MPRVAVATAFDHPGSRDFRFLQEASRLGELQALLWSDAALAGPGLPQAERLYFLQAMRYVGEAAVVEAAPGQPLPEGPGPRPDIWAVDEREDHPAKAAYCRDRGIGYHVVREADLAGFPVADEPAGGRRKVLVTGCFDWIHSGHVRFFEEVAELGDLYVVVGHDRNIRLLQGEGHPLFPELERRYLAGSIRYVKRALVSSGDGWLDAEPEINELKPDMYAVNEDGDKPEKREFCRAHGIEYVVLKRTPKPGLPARTSTDLRGF